MSRLALQRRDMTQPAARSAPARLGMPPREPAPPIWQAPPRLTPELIAAYKRKGDCLRARAFASVLRRAARWLIHGGEN